MSRFAIRIATLVGAGIIAGVCYTVRRSPSPGIRQSPPGRESTIYGNRYRVDSHYGDVGRHGRRRHDYSDRSLHRSGDAA